MEAYAIDQVMLAETDESKKRLVVRKDMDMSWWQQLHGLHMDVRWEIWWMFESCVIHCRCYTAWSAQSIKREPSGTVHRTIPVYGVESDVAYLDLLFTDLFIQLFAKLRPVFIPDESLGFNCWVAKEAGMSWEQIAHWAGMPDKVRKTEVYNSRSGGYDYKTSVDGIFVREYKRYCESHGLERRVVHPDAWAISYTGSFALQIRSRLRNFANESSDRNTSSVALVLRDIRKMAEDALFDDFPDLKPHEPDCKCEECTKKRKPVKYRQGHRMVAAASVQGRAAGAEARIVSNKPGVGGKQKGIDQ
jgi:hypothetical protein